MISRRVAGKRVVIVGGGGSGDAAAFALRKKGYDGDVVMLSADRDRPYDRPYLSKEFLRGEIELQKVFLHDEADYAKEKIELRLQERVVGGSMRDGTLSLQSGGQVRFDTLVLSTGGTPRRLPDAPDSYNVLTLRSLRDSQAVREALKRGSRLLLVGAGFIGAEVGASARQLGKEVLMVESAPVPLARALGTDVGELYASIHRSKGVDVRTGTTVKEWHSYGGRVVGVTLSDGTREEVDVVLIAIPTLMCLECSACPSRARACAWILVCGPPKVCTAAGTSRCTRTRCWSNRFEWSTGRWPSITDAASQPRSRQATHR